MLKVLVAIIVVSLVLSLLGLPIFDRTRDERYEIVSLDQGYWIHRDARFEVSSTMNSRTGFWCSYYEWATVTLVEKESVAGGQYRVTFTYPTYVGQPIDVYLGASETRVVSSDEVCSTAPGSIIITHSLLANPLRVYEQYRGVQGNNSDWELHAKLTLRELETKGGEYVVRFQVSPGGQDARTVRTQIFPSAVQDFDVSFDVPTGTCCSITYQVNAPKIQEKASLLSILSG